MFVVNDDYSIYATRGDVGAITITAEHNGEPYVFKTGDVVRFKVFEKKVCENVVLNKEVTVTQDTQSVELFLSGAETAFGQVINKPTEYWYEVELNPDTMPQTIVGYDEYGAKIFMLYPEGGKGV